MAMDSKQKQGVGVKKCPYCHQYMRADAATCPECKKTIKASDKFGIAKKPFNWQAYFKASIGIALFAAYLIWFYLNHVGD